MPQAQMPKGQADACKHAVSSPTPFWRKGWGTSTSPAVDERAECASGVLFGVFHESQDHAVERFAGVGMEDAWEERHLLLSLRQEGLEAAALVVLRQLERVADIQLRRVVTPRPERSESERQGAFIGE